MTGKRLKGVMLPMVTPTDWKLKGVAVLAFTEAKKIIMIKELTDRLEAGKYAGMASIPMGEIRPGETAEQAAVREFGEETGFGVVLDYPIGFFEIQVPDRNRVGVWAFFGHLRGDRVPRDGGVSQPFFITEREFLDLDPFGVRPLNREIYQQWKSLRALIKEGVSNWWIRTHAVYHAPAKARQWLARE